MVMLETEPHKSPFYIIMIKLTNLKPNNVPIALTPQVILFYILQHRIWILVKAKDMFCGGEI